MNRLELYKSIIESCDESLRDAFLRRMEAAIPIAQYKIENNAEIYIPESEERSVEHICRGVSSELKPQMLFLWRSLVRMNRGRQYAYFVNNMPDCKLGYDSFLSEDLPHGGILCAEGIKKEVEANYGRECIFSEDAVGDLIAGKANLAAVKILGYYSSASLYSRILHENVFVNDFTVLEDGAMLVLLANKLRALGHDDIITIAMAARMDILGHMTQQISIFAENGLNIEYLATKTQHIDDDDKKHLNIFFVELSGGCLTLKRTRAALLQLEKESPFFRVLGCRKSVDGGNNDT